MGETCCSIVVHDVVSPRGTHRAWVVTPSAAPCLDRDAIDELGRGASPTKSIAAWVTQQAGETTAPSVVLVRLVSASHNPWTVAPHLPVNDRTRLGQLWVRAMVVEARAMAATGILGLIYTDVEPQLLSWLRNGSQAEAHELRMRSRSDGSIADDVEEALRRLDAWLLRHSLFWFDRPATTVLDADTGDMVPMLERRAKVLRLLLGGASLLERPDPP